MAKVIVTADTDTGEMSATINGKSVENLRDVQMSYYPSHSEKYPNQASVSISTYTLDDNGVRHYGQICAAQSPEGKAATYAGGFNSEKYDGFVHNPNYESTDVKDKYTQATAAIKKAMGLR